MNILDLSENRQQIIADKLGIDVQELKSKLINDLLEADISNKQVTVSQDLAYRMSNELAIFIY